MGVAERCIRNNPMAKPSCTTRAYEECGGSSGPSKELSPGKSSSGSSKELSPGKAEPNCSDKYDWCVKKTEKCNLDYVQRVCKKSCKKCTPASSKGSSGPSKEPSPGKEPIAWFCSVTISGGVVLRTL